MRTSSGVSGARAVVMALASVVAATALWTAAAPGVVAPHVDIPALNPGALRLGTTNYPIPAVQAFFVAPTGNDAANGARATPWRTLGHAVAAAPAGATVILRAGIYREGVQISGKRLTLQNYPSEAVIVRGTQVTTGFVVAVAGKSWVRSGWNHQFPRQGPAKMLRRAAPLANAPDMVFVDGKQLRQVANPDNVRGNTFAVDYAKGQLTIGVDPTGRVIEAATIQVGLSVINAAGTIVRGIQFDEFATPYNPHGAVRDLSNGTTFENDIFTNNAMAGLTTSGSNTVVTHCTMSFNGQLGVHSYRSTNVRLYGNWVTRNNTALFDQKEEAGGVKASYSSGMRIDSNLIDHNLGTGTWFDLGSNNGVIVHNNFHANAAQGAEYEISSNAVIAGNVSWSNSGGGIRIIESQHIAVWNNVVYRNDTGIEVFDGGRPETPFDITIRNNILMDGHNITTTLLDVDDKTHHYSGAQMAVTADSDVFCRSVAATPPRVVDWSRGGGLGPATYTTLAPFVAATGNESHGVACEGPLAGAMFTNTKRGDFTLGPKSAARGVGTPLPADIAAVLGVAPGIAVNAGAL